jgi:hypothetical protein
MNTTPATALQVLADAAARKASDLVHASKVAWSFHTVCEATLSLFL